MPSAFHAMRFCIRMMAVDWCEIYSQRQRTLLSYFANISRVCFTYAAAKVLQNFDIRKKIRRKNDLPSQTGRFLTNSIYYPMAVYVGIFC